MKKRFYFLFSVTLILASCNSNPIIYSAEPTETKNNLLVSHPKSFQEIESSNVKYLTSTELYNAISVQYKLGETIGFRNDFYLKPMLKTYRSQEGDRKHITLRSYNSKDKLMDEITFARTDNDSIFSGLIFKDLSIKTFVNTQEKVFKISKNGTFEIIKP